MIFPKSGLIRGEYSMDRNVLINLIIYYFLSNILRFECLKTSENEIGILKVKF